MGPVPGLPVQRATVMAGRFAMLCFVLPVVSFLCHGAAQAGPLPTLSSLRATQGSEELHLLGLLPLEELLPSLGNKSLQKTFMEALPTDWALPTFSTSSVKEISELQAWLSKMKQQIDFGKLRNNLDPLSAARTEGEPSVIHELLEAVLETFLGGGSASGGAKLLLSGADLENALPSLLKDYTASLPLQGLPAVKDILLSTSGLPLDEVFMRKVQMLQRVPSLDQLDISKFVKMFAVPSDIEWPVERAKLALSLPVLTSAEDGGLLASPRTALVEGSGLTAVQTESGKLLLPLTQPDGQLLFAKLNEIFPYMELPQTLKVLPLATLKNTESRLPQYAYDGRFSFGLPTLCLRHYGQLATVEALWSGLKSALLPRQAIMSAENSSTLLGPVLNLTNLAKLILASCEPLRTQFLAHLRPSQTTAANAEDESGNRELLMAFSDALEAGLPLEDVLKNVFTELSTKLQRAILPFEGLIALDGTLPSPRFQHLDEWKSDWESISPVDFRDETFFRLQLPVIAVSRDSLSSTFRLLQRLPAPCTGVSGDATCALGLLPALPLNEDALEESVATLSRRVEVLAEQLKASVYQLQLKVADLIAAKAPAVLEGNSTTETNDATPKAPVREIPSSQDVKRPEGLLQDGRLFDFPNTFFSSGTRSNNKFSALQQALDASVTLCDTLSVALRFTKSEVKSLQQFSGHTGSIGRSRNQGGGHTRPLLSYFNDFDTWESPDLEYEVDSLKVLAQDNDSNRLPFLANIHGRSLVALPRAVLDNMIHGTKGSVRATAFQLDSSTSQHGQQFENQKDTMFDTTGSHEQKRRLQAALGSGALTAKRLVLLDPLTLGKILFVNVDGDRLLEGLKNGVDTTKIVARLGQPVKDAHGSTSDATIPPLLEDLLASNTLAFPAFTVPVADLLRVGVFPKALLQAPLGEWVPSTLNLPAEAAQYTVSELLQLQSLASRLKGLPLKDLLTGDSTLSAVVFPVSGDMLRQNLGDLHLKSLIPPQLADVPLEQLLKLPAKEKLQLTDLSKGFNALSLGKLLELDDAAISLLTQPFGDVLGLKNVLENLMCEELRASPTAPQEDTPGDNSEQPTMKHFKGDTAERLPKVLGSLVGGSQAARLPLGETDLLDLSVQKWLAPGSMPEKVNRLPLGHTVSLTHNLAESSFLPGKKDSTEGNQNSGSPTLADLAKGVRSQRPMTDLFRYLWNSAGVTFANELFF